MRREEKSYGWRVPILFCGAILLITGAASLLKNIRADLADYIPPALAEDARRSGIDMKTPENSPWREKIIAAASGFSSREEKDRNLADLVDGALAKGNFEAACAAFSQMGSGRYRQSASELIFRESLKNCGDLIWGVYVAARNEGFSGENEQTRELSRRWEECRNNKF